MSVHIDVPSVETQKLIDNKNTGESKSSVEIQEMVQKARDIQTERYEKSKFKSNSELTTRAVKAFCPLSAECRTMLLTATSTMNLSARSYFKVVKIARTIADLAGEKDITTSHLAEALQYRPKDSEL